MNKQATKADLYMVYFLLFSGITEIRWIALSCIFLAILIFLIKE